MIKHKYNKSLVLLLLFIIIGVIELYFKTGTVVFIAFGVMAVFSYLNSTSKNNINLSLEQEFNNRSYAFNKLNYYMLDETKCLGLFIKLFNKPFFIDLREDNLLEKRKKQALFLSKNTSLLEENLNAFWKEYPDYKNKTFEVIGLYYDDVTLGDIFWEPTGHTCIKNLDFKL